MCGLRAVALRCGAPSPADHSPPTRTHTVCCTCAAIVACLENLLRPRASTLKD